MDVAKLLPQGIGDGWVYLSEHSRYRPELVASRLLIVVKDKGDIAEHLVARFWSDDEGIIRSEVQSEVCQALCSIK